jgi:hypothetical protein
VSVALTTRSSAAVLAFLILPFGANFARANEVPVCSMPRDEFVELAFPDSATNKLHSGKLLKRVASPGLVVLVPSDRADASAEIESALALIADDNAILPARSSLLTYSNSLQLLNKIEELGNDNIFVVIAEHPSDSDESRQFRRALEYIVRWPREVEALMEQAKHPGGFTSRSRTDIKTT